MKKRLKTNQVLKWLALAVCLFQIISLFAVVPVALADNAPDLIVDSISITPANPNIGDTVSFSAVVRNIGDPIDGNSNFTVGWDLGEGKYMWSGPVTAALATDGTTTVNCTGGQYNNDGTWKAVAGDHTVNCMVDNYKEGDSKGWVHESDENNNAKTLNFSVPVPDKPDLVIDSLGITPKNPANGDTVNFSAVVKNIGAPIDVNSNFTVGWDLGEGKYMWSGPVTAALGTNETTTVNCTGGQYNVDGSWIAATGSYTLNSMVDNYKEGDSLGWVHEYDEANNSLTQDFTVTGTVDNSPKCYMIKSAWSGVSFAYLYQSGSKVKYGAQKDSDLTAQWFIDDHDTYVTIKNRATGQYLNAISSNVIQCTTVADPAQDSSAQWVVKVEGAGKSIKNVAYGQYINVEDKLGYVAYHDVQGTWTSADWILDNVNFVTCVRIKSGWDGINFGYLYQNGTQIKYGAPSADDETSQWLIEDKGSYALIKNRGTGQYVNFTADNVFQVTQSADITSDSAKWIITPGDYGSSIKNKGNGKLFNVEDKLGYVADNANVQEPWTSARWLMETMDTEETYMAGSTYVGSRYGAPTYVQANGQQSESKVKSVVDEFNQFYTTHDTALADSLVKYPIARAVINSPNQDNASKSMFGSYWDEKYLYMVVKAVDAVKRKTNTEVWNTDNVEVMLDMNNRKDLAYGADGFQFMFGYNYNTVTEYKHNAVDGVKQDQIDTADGYIKLISIPWSTIGKAPQKGMYIGLDVAIDDSFKPTGNQRDVQMIWNSKDSNAYQSPDRLGNCQLVLGVGEPRQLPVTRPEVHEVPIAPAYTVPQGRGAALPYVEYEAESASTNGTVSDASRTFGDEAAEASGRKYVRLDAVGKYVEFTATRAANSLVVRYSIPDAPSGGGITAPISVYINGVKTKELTLSSKYNWNYGDFPWFNNLSKGSPHHFFDESRALLDDIKAGDKVKLQVDDNAANAEYYLIDLIDMEKVAAPLSKPAGFVSITDYGAAADDPTKDATDAIYAAVKDAKAKSAAGVWIPKGTFYRTKGPHVDNTNTGFSGTGYVTGMDITGATAKIEPENIPQNGSVKVKLHYSNGSGSVQTLTVYSANSAAGQQITLEPTSNWNTWGDKEILLYLNQGISNIRFVHNEADTGNVNLDYVDINGTKVQMEVGRGNDRAYLTCPVYLDNITVRGAGMWYTTLEGYYNQILLTGSNCKFYDFSILGGTDSRTDELEDNAFSGCAGTGSVLQNIWVEHTKCGFWVGDTKYGQTDGLLITGCRFRDTMADGVNLCDGTINSIIENSQARNTGDDSFAIWSARYNQSKWGCDNNIIRNCTTQQPWLAQGIALYGGNGNSAIDNLLIDTPTASGILISTTFDCVPFGGLTTVARNSVVRSGDTRTNYGGIRIMLDGQDISGLRISDLDLYDNTDVGIRFMYGKKLTDSEITNVHISYCGLYGIYIPGDANGYAIFKNVTVDHTAYDALKKDSANFIAVKDSGNAGW